MRERVSGADHADGLRGVRAGAARHDAAVGVADQRDAAIIGQQHPDRFGSDLDHGPQRAGRIVEQIGGGKGEQRIGVRAVTQAVLPSGDTARRTGWQPA